MKKQNNWEEEFDKKFGEFPEMASKSGVKVFIRSLLASQRETLAMEIEGMKKDEEKARKFKGEDTSGWLLGTLNRNQALTDAAANIRKV